VAHFSIDIAQDSALAVFLLQLLTKDREQSRKPGVFDPAPQAAGCCCRSLLKYATTAGIP
jgi:hypothetical protein